MYKDFKPEIIIEIDRNLVNIVSGAVLDHKEAVRVAELSTLGRVDIVSVERGCVESASLKKQLCCS